MRNKIVLATLVIVMLALARVGVVQSRRIRELEARPAQPKPVEAAKTEVAQAALAKEPAVKEPVKAEAELDRQPVVKVAPEGTNAAPVAKPASTKASPMAGMAEMMKNPGMKDMIRAQQKGQMDLSYGPLFKHLPLSDEQLADFKELLLNKQMATMDSAFAMMNAKSQEDRKAAVDETKSITEAFNQQIKDFLDEEAYGLYMGYEETQPERMQVMMFKNSLARGSELTDEQEDRLIKSMHEKRKAFSFSAEGFNGANIDDPTKLTPEVTRTLLEENDRLHKEYIREAAFILSPDQQEKFKSNMDQMQTMMKFGFEMAAKMFGKEEQ